MDDAALTQLLDAAFAFVCGRRVAELVDVERLLAAADAAAEPSRGARLMARFIAPARARLLERARASALPLGVWLPDPVRDALAALLALPAPIPRALVDKVVADEHVRDSARAMLQEALSSFIHKAFSVTPGGRGLRGVIGLGARAAGGLFGGIGDEIQRQLEERVRDFVDGGVMMLQKSVAQKLTSDETARLLGKRRRAAFFELLKQPESQLARVVRKTPWEALDAMLPSWWRTTSRVPRCARRCAKRSPPSSPSCRRRRSASCSTSSACARWWPRRCARTACRWRALFLRRRNFPQLLQ